MACPTILIAGAGGFIGGHLVARLREPGTGSLRAVDIKPLEDWYQRFDDVENLSLDLRDLAACQRACDGVSSIYNLACDMGGMGFVELNKSLCMLNVLINTHLLTAAREARVKRFLFTSTACVYNVEKQASPDVEPLKEGDAYPAMPEDGYGWEKLFSERMCRHFSEDFGIETRVVRLHSVYGPHGTWDGGREKAPAAICRKVIEAKADGVAEIEIWGDGKQTRSFMYVDDCLHGLTAIMASDVSEPINLGSSDLFTIDALVDAVERVAGTRLTRRYRLEAPTGVNGRNSDNTLIRARLGWAPEIPLEVGIPKTYEWIEAQFMARRARRA